MSATHQYDVLNSVVPPGGNYVSAWFDGSCHGTVLVIVQCRSNAGSVPGGVLIEESDDGPGGAPAYTVSSGTAQPGMGFTLYGSIRRPTFRVRFSMAGTPAQPLQLTISGYATVPLSVDASGGLVVSSNPQGGNPSGPQNVNANVYNTVSVDPNAVQRPTYLASVRSQAIAFSSSASVVQLMTIHHAGTASKRVRILRVAVGLESHATTGILQVDIVRLTLATTTPMGGMLIVPNPLDPSDPPAASTVRVVPDSTGTEDANPSTLYPLTLALPTAPATAFTATPLLFDWRPGAGMKPLIIRPRVQEGYAVRFSLVSTASLVATAWMEFTEEDA